MGNKRMKTLILDIDYTLNTDDPSHVIKVAKEKGYNPYSREVWEMFKEKADDMDMGAHPVPKNHYKEFTKHYDQVIIISGRPERFRKSSERWLKKHGFYYDELILRPDAEITMTSREVKEHMAKRYGLFGFPEDFVAIDDDEGVVDYYRSIGVKTFKAPLEWTDALDYHKKLEEKLMSKSNRGLTDAQRSKIFKLRETGLSHREIAEKVGCSSSSVGRVLRAGKPKVEKVSRKRKTPREVIKTPKKELEKSLQFDLSDKTQPSTSVFWFFLMVAATWLVITGSIFLVRNSSEILGFLISLLGS